MLHLQDKNWLLLGMLGCSMAVNLIYIFDETAESEPAAPAAQEASVQVDEEAAAPAMPEAAQPDHSLSGDWKVLRAEVSHSLARTFSSTGVEGADALSAVYSRLFMWELDMRRDLMKGDKIEVVYRLADDGLPDVSAARYHSRKHSRTFSAYRWQATGDEFASYWGVDGTEATLRLRNSPIEGYEQITSLLKDRPTHQGMDFKTPTGTETTTPKSGKVTRVNFGRFSYNGNCVEVEFSDGVLAKWLHLSEVSVKPGQQLAAGAAVGLTGNTGRSTAPHLHYQLDKGRKNIDPVDYHGTVRRRLPSKVLSSFLRDTAPYMALMDGDDGLAGF